ncbi:hypothetical protein V8D89_003912 [Ganoderma adspersum]
MPAPVHLPNSRVLISDGASTRFAAIPQVPLTISNSDHAVLTPSLFTRDRPFGERIGDESAVATRDVARVYHMSITLTLASNFLVLRSNPKLDSTSGHGSGTKIPHELRVQVLDTLYMFVDRPDIRSAPAKPQVPLIDLGLSSEVEG